MMKKKAEIWKTLSEKQKKKYEDESKKDHTRREKEVLHLRQHGFFVDKNGVKSTDLKKKVSREDAKKATASKDQEKVKAKAERVKAQELKDAVKLAKTKAIEEVEGSEKIPRTGYELFYRVKFSQFCQKAEAKTAKQQIQATKSLIKAAWDEMSDSTQKKYLRDAMSLKNPEQPVAKPAVGKKRVRPASVDKAPTFNKNNKKQKK